jgi:dipeptidyl aminopeptidase/acylaminoacyl peptidase
VETDGSSSVAVAQTIASVRDALRADSVGSRMLAWSSAGDSTGRVATGDVIWNAAKQSGVMRFVGLTPNDTGRWQYQLWIFDRTRDQRYPVDGGVFDIPAGATEVLIPITAKVKVNDATMFAVTVEAPGGVVVSSRERLALIAQAGG